MQPLTASDELVQTLLQWEVEVVFGAPVEGLTGLLEALERSRSSIRLVRAVNPESAAFMASGYARLTGKLGVCLGGSGASGIRLLSGLYDAKLDGQPVLAVTGSPPRSVSGTFGRQDIPFERLFMDVVVYNTRLTSTQHIRSVTDLACRAAISQAGVAHISIPLDVQSEPAVNKGPAAANPDAALTQRLRQPPAGDLRRAVEILNEGKKIVIFVGRGAQGASAEIEVVAEKLGAPVIRTLPGKDILSDESPYAAGYLGPYGTPPARAALQGGDTLLLVGTSFPYLEYMPEASVLRSVQIDADPTRIGLRFRVDVGIIGDSQRSLREMLPQLEHHSDRAFIESIQQEIQAWQEVVQTRASDSSLPLKPQVVAWTLGQLLPSEALVACDAGNAAAWWARYIPARPGQRHLISGNLAAAGSSLPYLMAGLAAFPDRTGVAFTEGMGFAQCMSELPACVEQGLAAKIVVLNKLAPETSEPPLSYAAYAQACGAAGFTIREPFEVRSIIAEAIATPGVVLIDALVDPASHPD